MPPSTSQTVENTRQETSTVGLELFLEILRRNAGSSSAGGHDSTTAINHQLFQSLLLLHETGKVATTTGGGFDSVYLLERMPTGEVKFSDKCPICQERLLATGCNFLETTDVVVFPCPGRHKYHLECLGLWFRVQCGTTCPMDRVELEIAGA